MILPPPDQVWLAYTNGQYLMPRTDATDPTAVRYVLGADHDEALAYIERMTGGMLTDPVSALVELRFALGDNGKRNIPELIEYARSLAGKAQEESNG
jgi:hypothetical protein